MSDSASLLLGASAELRTLSWWLYIFTRWVGVVGSSFDERKQRNGHPNGVGFRLALFGERTGGSVALKIVPFVLF